MFRKLQSGYRFGFQRNPAEELDALHRILPNGGFAGQHDGIGFFVDGVGDVGDLGPGRMRVVDHGFEEMRRHDHAFAVLGTESHDGALDIRQVFQVDLHAEISARDHNAVRFLDDRFQVPDSFLVLDLRDDLYLPDLVAHQILQLLNISGLAHKRQGDEVHIPLQTKKNILDIFLRNRREIDTDAGEIHVAFALQKPAV